MPLPSCILSAAPLALLMFAAQPGQASMVTTALDLALAVLVQNTGSPGASATVTRRGQTLWSGASGFADPAAGVPFTKDTLSSIASVTKLVTSTIVLRLAQDGLIALDEVIAP